MVDFTFARATVDHTYGAKGNESVDPSVLLKLMSLFFHENVYSERQLMLRLPERLIPDSLHSFGSATPAFTGGALPMSQDM